MCKVCVVPNTNSEIDVDMQKILELAINDEKVNMFFNLMNNNLNEWNNLYKKLEIVIDDLKSSNKYSNFIENSDSLTKEKIKQFKQTANSYEAVGVIARHAKNIPAPKKIMKIKNAKILINNAVDDWLSLKAKWF